MMRTILVVPILIGLVHGFGGSEDRFIRKYAMMKIYESCFGPEVVKQIRKEMKAACAKCAALENPPRMPSPSRPTQPPQPPFVDQSLETMASPENTLFANQQTLDVDKLQQAILAFRPNPMPAPAIRPFPGATPGFYPGFPSSGFPGPLYYPGFQPAPYGSYGFPIVAQPFYGGNRMSRDMDIKHQLEVLTSKISGKVKNVTCVMQELGYLDENLEPNYMKITERIESLPVPEELRRDMQDGVSFCQQFSQCVPDVKREKSPLSRELIRPMFFFKCYKHKKLEACIMKDVREKYSGVSEDVLDGDVELRRTAKSSRLPGDEEIDDLASSMYDFLYGSDASVEMDSIF